MAVQQACRKFIADVWVANLSLLKGFIWIQMN